jgi:glycosyltransferase involved in cell wall biosynthesis
MISYLRSRTATFWAEEHKLVNLPTYKKTEEKTHFKIIIPSYNAEEWISRCLRSVERQNYRNYECIVVDDISTDKTWQLLETYKDKQNFTPVKNTEKKYALKNIYDSINASSPDNEDVIVVLDGDDWLSNENVLSKLDHEYSSQDIELTYGSFIRFPDGMIGEESSEYPQEVIDNNEFRSDKWRASHLRTFKYKLWSMIEKEDLIDEDGKFYETSYDQAMMLPMLEMAGQKSKFIEDILCVYNIGNPNAVNRTRQQKQYETMLKIRGKSKYESNSNRT